MDQIAGDFAALITAGDAANWLGIARFLLTKLTDGGVVQKFFTDKHASPSITGTDFAGQCLDCTPPR